MKRLSFFWLLFLIIYPLFTIPMLPLATRSIAQSTKSLNHPAIRNLSKTCRRCSRPLTCTEKLFWTGPIAGSILGAGASTYAIINTAPSDEKKAFDIGPVFAIPLGIVSGGIAGSIVGLGASCSATAIVAFSSGLGPTGTAVWAGSTLLTAYNMYPEKFQHLFDTDENKQNLK